MKRIAVLVALFGAALSAQTNVSNTKLSLLIPDLFGPNGLTLPNPSHQAHFSAAFQSNFAPFNSALASQLNSLPIPSPASGFTYSFDPTLGVYTRSTSSFGPILSERAETIGKDKMFFGFAFQHFGFNSLDGVDLNRVQSVFQHDQTTPDPNIKKDVITTQNRINLQINQSISFFTYGLTDRLDVSVAIPVVSASLSIASDATIQRIGTGSDDTIHYFVDANGNRTNIAAFANSGHAQGLGDVLVRAKGTIFRSDNLSLALGLDLRMPTGDAADFLGSGAYGVKPFIAASMRNRRVAPHVNFGYQWNGDSILAGDVRTGLKARLPRQLSYSVGVDAGINKKFSLAFDLLGQQIFSAERLRNSTFTAANGQNFGQIAFYTGNVNANSAAAGFKLNPISTLLVSFNLILPINDVGLQARVIPLVGVSYTF